MRLVLIGLALIATTWAAAPLHAEDAPPEGSPMAKLAFLVGELNGQGKQSQGAFQYNETFTGTWILDGQALEVRSQSTAGGQVVFRDRRIFSYDAQTKRYRMRQWGEGRVRIYEGSFIKGTYRFVETAQEGAKAPAWVYLFTPREKGGFDYQVRQRKGEEWTDWVEGTLTTQLKDPGKGGGLGLRQYDAKAAGMSAEVHHPDGKGPYPLLVFSPGGNAQSHKGYAHFGRWFASWGYVTVIVAFNDASGTERGSKFGKVIDWAHAECDREGSPLHGMLDKERTGTVGHSRGAFGALVAGSLDPRVDAVLALAPSGPREKPAAGHAPKACIIIGTADQFIMMARGAYSFQRGERFKVEIEGLGHMLSEREQVLKLVRRGTAFLQYALRGDARYREPLVEKGDGLVVEFSPPEGK